MDNEARFAIRPHPDRSDVVVIEIGDGYVNDETLYLITEMYLATHRESHCVLDLRRAGKLNRNVFEHIRVLAGELASAGRSFRILRPPHTAPKKFPVKREQVYDDEQDALASIPKSRKPRA